MEKIAAALIFIISFVMVTAMIAFMNLKYNNIFDFDFTPTEVATIAKTEEQVDSLKEELKPELSHEILDSLKEVGFDSAAVVNNNKKIVELTDSIKVLNSNIKKLESENKRLATNNKKDVTAEESKKKYQLWTKNTAKLYESMNSKKAAKIILKYSDNIAKDILYSMKKKKAAEILSEMNPEVAKRITRVP